MSYRARPKSQLIIGTSDGYTAKATGVATYLDATIPAWAAAANKLRIEGALFHDEAAAPGVWAACRPSDIKNGWTTSMTELLSSTLTGSKLDNRGMFLVGSGEANRSLYKIQRMTLDLKPQGSDVTSGESLSSVLAGTAIARSARCVHTYAGILPTVTLMRFHFWDAGSTAETPNGIRIGSWVKIWAEWD